VTIRIDLERLRHERDVRRSLSPPRPGPVPADLLDGVAAAAWSRQDFLAVTGTLAAGLLPHPPRLPFASPDTLTVRRQGDRVAFLLGRREAWSIDAALFAGRPRLAVRGKDVTVLTPVVVELRGARYPGTSLALTLRVTVTRAVGGYRLRLEFLRCGTGRVGWTAEVPFQDWLDGQAEATAHLDAARARGLLGGHLLQGLALLAPRGLRITVDPALGLTFAGPGELSGLLPSPVRSERVTLRALAPAEPSLFAGRPPQRSLLTVERGAQHWPAQLAHEHRDGWALRARGRNLFSTLRVEATDLASMAQFIPDEQPEGHVYFHPAAALAGLRLEQPSLVLARGHDRRDEEWAVVGDFPAHAGWLFHGGCGLELGTETATAPFILAASRDATRQLECAPAIRTLFAPLPGTIGRPLDLRGRNAHLTFENPRVGNPHPHPMTTGPLALAAGQRSSVLSRARERGAGDVVNMAEGSIAATLMREGGRGVRNTPAASSPSATSFSLLLRTGEPSSSSFSPLPRTGEGSGVRVAPGSGLSATATVLGRAALHLRVSFEDASLSVGATRPEDLLLLSFGFVNFTLQTSGGAMRLARTDPKAPTYLVVHFPPQHIVEDAFTEGEAADEGPILSIMSGESRLAFVVPDTVTEIPYTLEALLDWSRYDLSVAPTAVLSVSPVLQPVLPAPETTSGRPPVLEGEILPARASLDPAVSPALPQYTVPDILEPTPTETSLEIPYRLMLSPSEVGAWVHATAPVTRENPDTHLKRTELWHTRLGVRLDKDSPVDETNDLYRTVRAIYKRRYAHNPYIPQDYFEDHERALKNRALTEVDLYQLVLLTALRGGRTHSIRGFRGRRRNLYITPDSVPIAVNRLMLSALGGWLHAHGHWDTEAPVYKETPPPRFETNGVGGTVTLDLEDWRHIASMGRDQYVRTVHKGYLYPFGHRAAFITVTERQFDSSSAGATGYLRQRYYVVVRERTVGFDHLGLHYGSVTITTATTPSLAPPTTVPGVGSDSSSGTDEGGARAFVPYLGDNPFRFDMEGVDRAGHTTHWTQPLVFVRESIASGERAAVSTFYNKPENAALLRECSMGGQKVGFATPPVSKPDSTTLPTNSMTFTTNLPAVAALTPTLAALPPSPTDATPAFVAAARDDRRQGRRAGAALKDLSPSDLAAFFAPQLEQAQVTVQSIAQLTGKAAAPLTAHLADHYLTHGFDKGANPGQVFMQFVHNDANAVQQAAATFTADQAGGLATPHLIPVGLSTTLGPIGGLGDGAIPTTPDELKKKVQDSLLSAAKAQLNPLDFLGKESKVLGNIGLADIIDVPTIPDPTHFESKGLKILTQTFYKGADGQETTTMPQPSPSHPDPAQVIPIAIQTSIDWTPDVKSFPESGSVFLAYKDGAGDNPFKDGKATALEITGKLRTELGGDSTGKTSYTMHGQLANFSLQLLPGVAEILRIDFSALTFDAHTGGKPSVAPKVSDVTFIGPLSFVNVLKQFISGGGGGGAALLGPSLAGAQPGLLPADSRQLAPGNARPALPPNRHVSRPPEGGVFGGGPSLDITPAGITVGYTLPIPGIGVGVFSLENIKLSASLGLPFNGDPVTVRFAFCERQDPFTLSVYGFAGGGFLGITLSAKEIVLFEGALEFGGNVSFDLVVASGGVHIMAGIYFRDGPNAKTGKRDFLLEGYLRAGGSLSVLGLITISVEFYLGLSYEAGVVAGTASLTVDVDLTLFHKSVTLTVHKEFGGSGSGALQPNGELAALPRAGLDDALDGVLPALNPDGIAAGRTATGRRRGVAAGGDTSLPFTAVMSERQWDDYIAAFD